MSKFGFSRQYAALAAILLAVGTAYVCNGIVMLLAPLWWYEVVPGIQAMGLYNTHFVRDIGLAYAVAGVGLYCALRNRAVGLFACIWPGLHAFYHCIIFIERGAPFDAVSLTNLLLIQLPAWASLYAVQYLPR